MDAERLRARQTQVNNLLALEKLLSNQIDAEVSQGRNPRGLKRKRDEVRVTLEDATGALSHELYLAQIEGVSP